YTFGRNGYTGLNWYDAADPRPDYYRYLPSFQQNLNPELAAQMTNAWENDENTRQLNWDNFYFANGKNLFMVRNPNGMEGETFTANRSKYVLEELRTDR